MYLDWVAWTVNSVETKMIELSIYGLFAIYTTTGERECPSSLAHISFGAISFDAVSSLLLLQLL